MKRLERIIALLKDTPMEHPSPEIQQAKGKFKHPYSIKEIYRMEKRDLKYRKRARKDS